MLNSNLECKYKDIGFFLKKMFLILIMIRKEKRGRELEVILSKNSLKKQK